MQRNEQTILATILLAISAGCGVTGPEDLADGAPNASAVGEFSGDGRRDMIISTASGSFEYLGLRAGGFTANA
jgi:hypothetical protein